MLKRLLNLFFKKSEKETPKDEMFLAECGHECKEIDNVTAFNETVQIKIPIVDSKTKYCHRCLEKMAICCAFCGKPIFIGNQVNIHTKRNRNTEIPEESVVYSNETPIYVCCQRSDCTETKVDYCGIWMPPGEVWKMPSDLDLPRYICAR